MPGPDAQRLGRSAATPLMLVGAVMVEYLMWAGKAAVLKALTGG